MDNPQQMSSESNREEESREEEPREEEPREEEPREEEPRLEEPRDENPEEDSQIRTYSLAEFLFNDFEYPEILEHNSFQDVNVFKVRSQNLAIILLQHPTKFIIDGTLTIRPLIGSVVINGHHLLPDNFITTFSSLRFGYLPISTEESSMSQNLNSNVPDRLKKALKQVGAEAMLEHVMKAYKSNCVMLAFKKPSQVLHVDFTSNVMNSPFFMPFENNSCPLLGSLGIRFSKNCYYTRLIEASMEQKMLVDELLESTRILEIQEVFPIIIICGENKVGKSTYLSYIVNRFLEKYEYLYHMELDPAHPQFTPPGCISLTKVTSPILGPFFTQQRKPELSTYLGQKINKIGNTYHAAMLGLINHFINVVNKKIPLLINTMGKGTGLEFQFLIDLIRYIRPTHVIQIYKKNETMPRLTPAFLTQARGWGSEAFMSTRNYILFEIPTVKVKCFTIGISHKKQPSLGICSYLGRLQSTSIVRSLNHFSSYDVKWSSIAVCFCNNDVPESQMMQALIGSFVGLCDLKEEHLQSLKPSTPGYPVIIPKCAVNNCMGFGVINCIDLLRKTFLIVTPEPLSTLSYVNALFHGQIPVPDELLSQQGNDQKLPYMSQLAQSQNTSQSSA